ncbi:MAG: tRNA 2-thiouridine(34) synthase MnmA [Candidatus Kuenenbacteria bacterium]
MKNKNKKKIVVGMSGGVDSSVALILLKKASWQPVGVSLKYAIWQDKENSLRENVCCSQESFDVAKKICEKLGVEHYVFDVSSEFKKEVIDYFMDELKNNKTPNPCVVCNPNLKFKKLFEWAEDRNIQYVATGHYAKTKCKKQLTGNRECLLLKSKDKHKDQTYSLSFLPQKYLKHLVFPIGKYTKPQVYKIAKREGFDFFEKMKQSQDFCFVAGKSMSKFLSKVIGKKAGEIHDTYGNLLGKHQGLHFYTLGQRKGIKLAGGPWFVAGFDITKNILIVSKNENNLKAQQAILSPFHFISSKPLEKPLKVKAKIRYAHKAAKAVLYPAENGKLKIIFKKPQKSITPGQYAVFYKGKVCLGGGKIEKRGQEPFIYPFKKL